KCGNHPYRRCVDQVDDGHRVDTEPGFGYHKGMPCRSCASILSRSRSTGTVLARIRIWSTRWESAVRNCSTGFSTRGPGSECMDTKMAKQAQTIIWRRKVSTASVPGSSVETCSVPSGDRGPMTNGKAGGV